MTVDQFKTASPEQMGNDPQIEKMWAEAAFKHAETYMKILKLYKDKKTLRITSIDDEVYAHFRKVFPDLDVKDLDAKKLKSTSMLVLWRPFCMSYQTKKMTDYNYGSLLRLRAYEDLSEDNSIIVPRVQFNAIEIARNREGLNTNLP